MTPGASEAHYIDTHAHLDVAQFADDVADVLDRARAAGVHHVINIGYSPAHWQTTLHLADRHPMVGFTLGVHPHHADEWKAETEAQLESLLDSTPAVAIGEIGIDLYRDGPPLATQRLTFDAQLKIAIRRGLPVVVHQRAAEGEVLDVLAQTPPGLVCVLHSFEGSADMVSFGSARGYYFGVGGLMTRRESGVLTDVLKEIPSELLLLETDSPYLTPAGVKSRRNEPANIPVIADRLARLRSAPVEEIRRVTTENALRVFGPRANSSATR